MVTPNLIVSVILDPGLYIRDYPIGSTSVQEASVVERSFSLGPLGLRSVGWLLIAQNRSKYNIIIIIIGRMAVYYMAGYLDEGDDDGL